MSKRRVLMLLENCPYPRDIRVSHEAETLTAAGYLAAVICPRASGQPWYEIRHGVHVYRFPAPPPVSGIAGYLLEYIYCMICILGLSVVVWWRHGFDVIHAHNPPDYFFLLVPLLKPLGKQFVFDHHDLAPEMYRSLFPDKGPNLLYRLLIWCERLSYRCADHAIVTNQSTRQIALGRGGMPEERITVVRNGPSLARWQPDDPDPALRVPGKTTICYAGVMGRHDGLDYLLRAIRHMVYDMNRTDFTCVIVGDGDALAGLKRMAVELALEDYVVFLGWVERDDLVRYLNSADICVAPEPFNDYNNRSTSIKVMEYMAIGKPVVAFELPEHQATAQDAALYATPNDEFDFARRLVHLIDHPAERQTLGQQGRARIVQTLAWEHQAAHLLSAYNMLTTTRRQVPVWSRRRFKFGQRSRLPEPDELSQRK